MEFDRSIEINTVLQKKSSCARNATYKL